MALGNSRRLCGSLGNSGEPLRELCKVPYIDEPLINLPAAVVNCAARKLCRRLRPRPIFVSKDKYLSHKTIICIERQICVSKDNLLS